MGAKEALNTMIIVMKSLRRPLLVFLDLLLDSHGQD